VEGRPSPTARVLVWVARISSEADAWAADPGLARKSEKESRRAKEPEEDGPDGGKILNRVNGNGEFPQLRMLASRVHPGKRSRRAVARPDPSLARKLLAQG